MVDNTTLNHKRNDSKRMMAHLVHMRLTDKRLSVKSGNWHKHGNTVFFIIGNGAC